FGISKYMEMAGGHTTTAPLGLSKGYAPMEQYGGTITDFSKATDVYSICATLYKMVTGVTPPEPLQIHTNGLKTPRELNSQLSLKFSNIITKGLSFKATDRPQSMSELRNQFSITENNSDRKTTPTVVFLEPKKSISSWFLVFLLGVVIIIGSYFYDSISFKQRPLESPPLPDIVANNTDSTSTKPTSNSQNTVNEPLKEETQQNIETVSQTVEVSPTKSKSEIITGTVTDIDGNVYKTVKIGNQVWMAENLRVTHYRNGEGILNITNGQEWWYTTESAWCYYDNNPSKGLKYGILYNGFAVINEKKIAPSGWHIPTDDEWTTIIDYLGGEESAGGQMKKTGYSYWKKPNINANNKSSFSALPGGIRTSSDQNMGYVGYWWSSSTTKIAIYNSDKGIVRSPIYKAQGLSIRCIKDK
ncbi:MAG: FISUMP domain-containing protein, partial [Paludibacter sp.]